MNAELANIQRDAIVLTGPEGCVVKTTRNIKRKGTIKMKQLDAINMRIASKPIIEALKEKGLIYQGEDGQLHVIEQRKSTTTPADQS